MSDQVTPMLWSPLHAGTESPVPWGTSSPPRVVLLVAAGALTASCLLVAPGTGAPAAFFAGEVTTDHALGAMAPIAPTSPTAPPPSARFVRDLKERSGLTWDQLAAVFGVSRRAVHGWASGARLNAQHSEFLTWLRQTLTRLEHPGDPNATRAALLEAVASTRQPVTPALVSRQAGISPFERIAVRHEDERWPDSQGEPIRMVDPD